MSQDGRNIDAALGVLEGEGAGQQIEKPEAEFPPRAVLPEEPARVQGADEGTTYYGLPVIKEPVWIWTIPTYFFVGGLAGACNVLGAAARAFGGEKLRPLVLRARWTGAVGDALSAVLLISDLGRPTRFLNMLRVFRPSSPMSVGSWILAACGAFSGASALFGFAPGLLGRFGDLSSYMAAVLGLPLAGYTGVLVANTAVPAWQGGRRALPVLFMSSAAASAGSFLELIARREEGAAAARRFGSVGKAAELVAGFVYEQEVGKVERVARPLDRGVSGALWKAARALTLASLGLSLLPSLSKAKRVAAGLTGLAGALALRFAVFHAGKASARDPRATFEQQRAGKGAEEVTGPKFDQIPADYAVPYEGAYPH